MTLKRIGLITTALLVVMIAILARQDRGTAEQVAPVPATAEQAKEFEALLRQDERLQFNSMVNGDATLFPTLYYNDPTVELNADYQAILNQDAERANTALKTLQPGPIGAERGYLTAVLAIVLERQASVDAWAAAQARATAEGRQATSADMPNGETPYEPKQPDEWVDVPFNVYDVMIMGDHATAKLTFGPPEESMVVLRYTFTRVEGRWYISGLAGEAPPLPVDQRLDSLPVSSAR